MKHFLSMIKTIFKREFKSYFNSSIAYVVLILFLMLQGFFTFYVSGFYEIGQADLQPFFNWFPWIFLFLIPAVTMRLWSDERRIGTMELLLTFPVTLNEIILGKFLAAWAFVGLAVLLTFPIVITTAFLGNPDFGAIISGYLGTILMSGAFISIGAFASSITRSQVISFILALSISLFLILAGHTPVIDAISSIMPDAVVNIVSSLSILTHYKSSIKGVMDMRDFSYYLSIIIFMLYANAVVIKQNQE